MRTERDRQILDPAKDPPAILRTRPARLATGGPNHLWLKIAARPTPLHERQEEV